MRFRISIERLGESLDGSGETHGRNRPAHHHALYLAPRHLLDGPFVCGSTLDKRVAGEGSGDESIGCPQHDGLVPCGIEDAGSLGSLTVADLIGEATQHGGQDERHVETLQLAGVEKHERILVPLDGNDLRPHSRHDLRIAKDWLALQGNGRTATSTALRHVVQPTPERRAGSSSRP